MFKMNIPVLCLIFSACVASSAPVPKDRGKNTVAELTGKWSLVKIEVGERVTPDEHKQLQLTVDLLITADTWSITAKSKSNSATVERSFQYKLDIHNSASKLLLHKMLKEKAEVGAPYAILEDTHLLVQCDEKSLILIWKVEKPEEYPKVDLANLNADTDVVRWTFKKIISK